MLRFVQAEAPAALESRGNVAVLLTIDVDATGKVTQVEVAEPAGEGFDEAAVAAARQFVFQPGEAGGTTVPVRITYRYRFAWQAPPATPAPSAPAVATVPFSGTVLRKGDRVPLDGVVVIIDEDQFRTVTAAGGRFAFDALPVGDHRVRLRGATIGSVDATLILRQGRALESTYYVQSQERYASTVRGQRAVVESVEHVLQAEELKRIPGTQGDTLKAVTNLPGVARPPFGLGLLVVWGSSPQDTRVYVDGVHIPTLYHFGGLRSTVNSEMVGSLSFVPGGYQVNHGLGMGGVVAVETRQPRRDGFHGYAQMDLLDGSLMLEGPLTKTLSFAVAARRSWIDVFLPHLSTNNLQISPKYWDYQARLSWRPTPRDDVDLFLFGSDDKISLTGSAREDALSVAVQSHTLFHRGIVAWQHRFERGATFSLTSSLGFDVPFQVGLQLGNTPTSVDATTLEYTLRAVARVPLASWLRLDAGLDFEGDRHRIDRMASVPRPDSGSALPGQNLGIGRSSSGYATEAFTLLANHAAPFVAANVTLLERRLTITPQLRLQVFTFRGESNQSPAASHSYLAPEPRLSLRYQVNQRWAVKGALGLYHQAPDAQALSPVFGNPHLTPQKAVHTVVGVEVALTPKLQLAINGFHKNLSNLVVRGANPEDPILVNDGRGRVWGAEFMLRQQLARRFFGWASYTLSRSQRKHHPDEAWHTFEFDQTHILTLMGSYQFGRGYQVGLRYRYVTGNPQTPINGAYYDSNRDSYRPITGQPYAARLGSFSQLDLRLDKTWTFDRWRFSAYLDLQNVTNTSNAEATDYNFNYRQTQNISGLPFLPVFGLRGDF